MNLFLVAKLTFCQFQVFAYMKQIFLRIIYFSVSSQDNFQLIIMLSLAQKRPSSPKELLHSNRYLPHQFSTDLFTTTVSEPYKQEVHRQKLKCKDFQKNTGRNSLLPRWPNLETRRRAKCSNTKCDKNLKSGFLWFCVSGVHSVAYQTEKAVLRKFYFYPVKAYIMQVHPRQTENYRHI